MRCREFLKDLPPNATLIRFGLGALLLTAALAKGHHVFSAGPTSASHVVPRALPVLLIPSDDWESNWTVLPLIFLEVSLGFWLWSNRRPRPACVVAILAFAGFACYSLIALLEGRESCGCFGDVKVSPLLTLIIDLTAICALILIRPKRLCTASPEFTVTAPMRLLLSRLIQFAALSFCILLGVGIVWVISGGSPRLFVSIKANEVVVLDPHNWVGGELPLLDFIDIGSELRHGHWIVIFYHHDCSKCKQILNLYDKSVPLGQERVRLAAIEMPPYGPPVSHESTEFVKRGRLSNAREWFGTAPIVVRVRDSLVATIESQASSPQNVSF